MDVKNLILARRVGETLVIDNDTRITVLAIKGEQVKLGVISSDADITEDLRHQDSGEDQIATPALHPPAL